MQPVMFVLWPGQQIVSAGKMMFCLCSVCANELNWVHTDASFGMVSSCCRMVHDARPARPDSLEYFFVESQWAENFSNVKWLFRNGLKPKVHTGATPQPPEAS